MTNARVRIGKSSLSLTGPLVIADHDGHELLVPEGERVSLCRCGQSKAKPFCDSSHREAGFESRPCLLDTEEGKAAVKPPVVA